MFMIPKTFAYMTAFVYIIKGVIKPMPVPMEENVHYKQAAPQAVA